MKGTFRWDIFAVIAAICVLCIVSIVITAQADDKKPEEGKLIKTESGLQYQDEKVGTGAKARNGSKVSVHYTGKLKDGTIFDSSTGKDPYTLTLGKKEVIAGWEEGLLGMKVGGKRKLIIPAELAYGSKGQGKIPPNAELYFDLELMDAK